ncbi:MAG: DUF3368 domain-containing protein [Bacteroidota bacterium]
MQKTIISDTSCLILLTKIGQLELLRKLFGRIILTEEIIKEFNEELPDWFDVRSSSNKNYQKILEASLDKGEASAIALALEQSDCLLIIDDLKGRKYAEQLGIKITGTLGILVDAKLNGFLTSVRPSLKSLKLANFRLSEELENKALLKAREL